MSAPTVASLTCSVRRFPEEKMEKHGDLLGMAGQKLSDAFETARVVAGLADQLRADLINQEVDKGVLNPNQHDHLLAAIFLLSRSLSYDLCETAERFEKRLSNVKPSRTKRSA